MILFHDTIHEIGSNFEKTTHGLQEAVVRRRSVKKVFLEISKNSHNSSEFFKISKNTLS